MSTAVADSTATPITNALDGRSTTTLRHRPSHLCSPSPPSRPPSRPRAFSFHPSSTPIAASANAPPTVTLKPHHQQPVTSRAGAVLARSSLYGSSLLESLDLSGSVYNLRQYLLGKLEEAEEGVRALKAFMDASSGHLEESGDAAVWEAETDEDESQETEDDEHDVVDLVTAKRRRQQPCKREGITVKGTSSAGSFDPSSNSAFASASLDDLTSLEQFIQTATSFLSALRAELPTLSTSSSTSLMEFQISPEALETLSQFLKDHPLPSFPSLSSVSLLQKVQLSLSALQELVARPPSPLTPGLGKGMREYFVSEAQNLGGKVRDEVSEVVGLVADKGVKVLDEASKMYNAAVERGRKGLLHYHELPDEWRNNEHILSGYRFIGIESWGTLLRSGFRYHNETVNIQTHFWGFVFLLYLLYLLPSTPHYLPDSHWGDTAIAVLFLVAGMKCLLCSAAWHLLSGCATLHLFQGAACVDYVGISGLITSSVMAVEYYGFYCHSNLALGYMMFTATLGIAGMILPWKPWFNKQEYKNWRIAFFLGLAASAIMPVMHMCVMYGIKPTATFLYPVVPSVASYLFGLSFYANRFPEVIAPGRWDHLFASHQVWHLSIIMGTWTHWRAMNQWVTEAARFSGCA